MLRKLKKILKNDKLTILWGFAKKKLTATPVKINEKPIALWKLLLPIPLITLIILISLIVNQVNRPLTPDEIAQVNYQKARENAETLSSTVAKQTEVPKDETPNVATITDVTLLQDQEFFKKAKNGDKILIYEKKKVIVLYRPSEEKVIATAPVLYNQPENVAGIGSPSAIPSASSSAN